MMNTLVVLLPQLLRYVGWMSKEEQGVRMCTVIFPYGVLSSTDHIYCHSQLNPITLLFTPLPLPSIPFLCTPLPLLSLSYSYASLYVHCSIPFDLPPSSHLPCYLLHTLLSFYSLPPLSLQFPLSPPPIPPFLPPTHHSCSLHLCSIGLLLCIIFYSYAIIGMEIFHGTVREGCCRR